MRCLRVLLSCISFALSLVFLIFLVIAFQQMMDRLSSSAFTASNIDDFYENNVEFSVGIAFPQAGQWYFRLLSRGHGVSTSFGTIAIGWEMVAQLRRFQKVGLATSCAVSAIEIAGTHGHLLIFLYLFLIFHAGHAVANSFTVHSFLFVFALVVRGFRLAWPPNRLQEVLGQACSADASSASRYGERSNAPQATVIHLFHA